MYNQFYGFRENPFSLLPDPDFLYVSREHGTVLNLLELAILNQSGFCVISGEVGAGKTTIVRELLNRLDDQVSVGLITNTHASFSDLMRWILAAFELKAESDEGVFMHRQFTEFVTGQFSNGRHTLLIIDEAQNLSVAALEQLRMLSNINSGSDLLLQVILVGQKELRENLRRPELEQFAQRISIDYFLAPLDEAETTAYIEHRVAHAGGKNPLFDSEACKQVYKYSRGIPRVINRLCDLSLVYGYAENAQSIGVKLVDAVVRKQKLDKPRIKRNKKTADAVNNEGTRKQPLLRDKAAPTENSEQVQNEAPELLDGGKEMLQNDKKQCMTIDTGERAMKKTSGAAKTDVHHAQGDTEAEQSVDTSAISAEEAVKYREHLERIAAKQTEHAVAAVETAATNLAASRQAETEKLTAEQQLEEAVSVNENTSRLAAAAKSAAETTSAEREAAEAVALEKRKVAESAFERVKAEKTAAAERVAQITGIEKEAKLAAEQAIVAAEKALAERVAAEKSAAEAAAAASDLLNKATEERIAVETETNSRLADVEQAATLAAAEHNRASQEAVEKVNNEKAAKAHAEACARNAKEKAALRVEASQLAEKKINTARERREAADASREAAEKAVAKQVEAERAAVASATVEKLAMASVAADEAAEALRMAETADAARQTAVREAADAKAAAEAAAKRAAAARTAAEKAAALENNEMADMVEARPVSRPLTEGPAIKELLQTTAPEVLKGAKEGGSRNTGRAWAAMAITAVVAGAAWFVIQSDDLGSDVGSRTLAGSVGTPQKQSDSVTVETSAMEISGKVRKPGK